MENSLVFERANGAETENWEVDDLLWRDSEAKHNNPTAVVLKISMAKPNALFSSRRLDSAATSLMDECRKRSAAFVGIGVADSYVTAAMYCAGVRQADAIARVVNKSSLCVEAQCYEDPDWVIFARDIYPSAALRQTIKNIETSAIYAKRGDDHSAPRKVSHRVAFPDEVSRLGFCEEVRLAGFALGDSDFSAESPLPHVMTVYRITPIDKHSINEATTAIINVAEKYGGEYLYWDCPVIGKKRY